MCVRMALSWPLERVAGSRSALPRGSRTAPGRAKGLEENGAEPSGGGGERGIFKHRGQGQARCAFRACGVVVLLSVSGRLRVPPDLAHSMTKERNVRKMSECTFPNAKRNYNVKSFKNETKLFILTIRNVSKHPLRNQEELPSSSTGPQTPTHPVFYPYGLTIFQISAHLDSPTIPPSRKSGTPSRK